MNSRRKTSEITSPKRDYSGPGIRGHIEGAYQTIAPKNTDTEYLHEDGITFQCGRGTRVERKCIIDKTRNKYRTKHVAGS